MDIVDQIITVVADHEDELNPAIDSVGDAVDNAPGGRRDAHVDRA